MKIWYLSHRRAGNALMRLHFCAVLTEPSLLSHIKYVSRWMSKPWARHLAQLDGEHERLNLKECDMYNFFMGWTIIYLLCFYSVVLLELSGWDHRNDLWLKWFFFVPYHHWVLSTGDKNISILHLSCRTSDLQFSLVLQTHALVL